MTGFSKSLEPYLETIYELQMQSGSASVTDIARIRGVKSPSVTYVLQKLREAGYVHYERYKSVNLTPKGLKLAEKLEKAHETLRWFFRLIGIDSEIAEADACEIEHIAHPETIEKLTRFADYVKSAGDDAPWIKEFQAAVPD
ncbi:MAG: metal-dependent transcriptional regulator [Candidatus Thorarchaeota archaeon]